MVDEEKPKYEVLNIGHYNNAITNYVTSLKTTNNNMMVMAKLLETGDRNIKHQCIKFIRNNQQNNS